MLESPPTSGVPVLGANAVFVDGRLLLSSSFDRIMPGFMGDVSERFQLPAKAMIVSLKMGILAGVLFVEPLVEIAEIKIEDSNRRLTLIQNTKKAKYDSQVH